MPDPHRGRRGRWLDGGTRRHVVRSSHSGSLHLRAPWNGFVSLKWRSLALLLARRSRQSWKIKVEAEGSSGSCATRKRYSALIEPHVDSDLDLRRNMFRTSREVFPPSHEHEHARRALHRLCAAGQYLLKHNIPPEHLMRIYCAAHKFTRNKDKLLQNQTHIFEVERCYTDLDMAPPNPV